MQCIDFRKIAYLYGVIARKRTMTYIKKRFLAPFRETEIWKISPQVDGENQSLRGVVSIQLLDVLYTLMRSARCVLLCIQKHGAMFSVFILQGFSRCPVSMMPRTRSRASFCVGMCMKSANSCGRLRNLCKFAK